MRKNGLYSSGEFAHMAHITKKTLRYYDEHNILKPSYVTEAGARFYSDEDFARLQQILLFKYLGFSLDEIKELTIKDTDYHFMANSLNLQRRLVDDRIEQLQLVSETIKDTEQKIKENQKVDWSRMLTLIHLTSLEKSLKNQYQNASNISARIRLHHLYSQNRQGWFPWIFEQMELSDGMKLLELGCGDGTLWNENQKKIPKNLHVVLSDRSEGMLRDARRVLGAEDARFQFKQFDCSEIPFMDEEFDAVIANHLLFYCEDIEKVCRQVFRVLKKGGVFLCSTYGENHMKEISQLVRAFDERIVLSAENLYERFGKKNGMNLLKEYFDLVEWREYEDELIVPEAEALISYILSCHGNQNQYILDRYKEFHTFVEKKTRGGFHITKEAGMFYCKK